MTRLRAHGAALALLVLAVVLRVAWIGDYPAFHPDEGFWSGGPRNLVRFGEAFLDNRLHPYLSPATFAALLAWFGAFPASLTTARLFSAAAGIATCVLVWDTARTLLPKRAWLPVLFFGVSGFVVLIDRTLLLEAHQTFWLMLAAAPLFAGIPGTRPAADKASPLQARTVLFAGAAFGMALLVKSSSFYVIPAFLIALLPDSPFRFGQRPAGTRHFLADAALFFAAAAVVAGAGYGLAIARDPDRFRAAFAYELEAGHFLGRIYDPVAFHFGRFGFRPVAAILCTLTLARSDPFLVLLGAVGVIRVVRWPGRASRAQRFFAVWALGGFAFAVLQLNVTYRYFGTLAPALAFLASYVAEDVFSAPPEETPTPVPAPSASAPSAPAPTTPAPRYDGDSLIGRSFRVFAFCGVFLGFHLSRLVFGYEEHPNQDYWRAVQYVADHAPRDTGVLAASYVALSVPQKGYDYFRLLRPYGQEDHPLPMAPEVERRHITYFVRDIEWRAFETPDMAAFLASRCTVVARFGDYQVLALRPAELERTSER